MVMSPMKVLPTGCQYRSLTYNKKDMKKILFWFKERASKRQKHNRKVMEELLSKLNKEIKSNYWSADISGFMKKSLADEFHGRFRQYVNEAYRELK